MHSELWREALDELLYGDADHAFLTAARAVAATPRGADLERILVELADAEPTRAREAAVESVRRLVTLALVAAWPSSAPLLAPFRSERGAPVAGRVVVAAGGTGPEMEEGIERYRAPVLEAFASFGGVLVYGGTRHGVGRLAGDVRATRGRAIRALGYVPRRMPNRVIAETDPGRCDELRVSDGEGFGVAEPLMYWADILAGGVRPSAVGVLGIGGGRISAAEYRMALALGAAVGVVAGSGRAADALLADSYWGRHPGLARLVPDPDVVRRFLDLGRAGR